MDAVAKLKSMLGAGGAVKANQDEAEKDLSVSPKEDSSSKSAMLMAAMNKPPAAKKEKAKGTPSSGAPQARTPAKKETAPADKVLEKKKAAAPKAEKEVEEVAETPDGRKCFSLKKLRSIGSTVYMDLTEFDCPDDVQEFVTAYMSSADKDRVRPNAARPLAMTWTDKCMRYMTKEQSKMEKVAERAALAKEARGAPGQAKDPKQQQQEKALSWGRGVTDVTSGPVQSKADRQREQFEAERAQILKEREEAKTTNPDSFKDGLRVDASYHQESDDIMAELMASSAQSIKKEQKQAAPEPALAPAPLADSSGWGGPSAPDSPGGGLGNLGLGLTLGALGNLESPERGLDRLEDGDEDELGNLDDLIGSDFGALLGSLEDLVIESGASGSKEPSESGPSIFSDLLDSPPRNDNQSSPPRDAPPSAAAVPPLSPQAPVTLANAAASKTASERLMSLSPEEKAERDRTLTETLHQMGQSSQAYQLQLRHLAAHYQHQAAHGGQVDPQLLHQIYTTKMNLQNLSAHYVHFMGLVNSGAPLPLSPMRQAAAGPPPPGPEAAPAPDVKRSVEVDNRAPTSPADFPVSEQQAAAPKAKGQFVNVNALFAAKKAETASSGGDKIRGEGMSAVPPQPKGRAVNVLSLFAAAAAADKAKSGAAETNTASSVDFTSPTASSEAVAGDNKFAFHNADTKKKKKGSAMSAASKMKLLQMKKADSTK